MHQWSRHVLLVPIIRPAGRASKIQTPGIQLFTIGRPQNFAHIAAGQTDHAASHRDASSLPYYFFAAIDLVGLVCIAVGLTAPQNWRHSNGPIKESLGRKGLRDSTWWL